MTYSRSTEASTASQLLNVSEYPPLDPKVKHFRASFGRVIGSRVIRDDSRAAPTFRGRARDQEHTRLDLLFPHLHESPPDPRAYTHVLIVPRRCFGLTSSAVEHFQVDVAQASRL